MPRRARWIRIPSSATPRTQGQNVPTTYHAPRIERLNTTNTTKVRADRLARYTRLCARLRSSQNNSTLGHNKHSAITPAVTPKVNMADSSQLKTDGSSSTGFEHVRQYLKIPTFPICLRKIGNILP